MKTTLISAIVICLFPVFLQAQISSETIKTDSGTVKITGTSTGMYNSSNIPEAVKYFEQASDYGDQNDFENAKKYYLKAIAVDPNFVEAYDNVAVIFRKQKDYTKAIEYYKKSIEIYPQGHMAHQNLAVVYGIQKDYASAITEYEVLKDMNPNDPEAYFGLANCHMMLSEFEEALPHAEKALKLYEAESSPFVGDGQYMIGLIYYYSGDNKNAKKYMKLAIANGVQIDPNIQKALKL